MDGEAVLILIGGMIRQSVHYGNNVNCVPAFGKLINAKITNVG